MQARSTWTTGAGIVAAGVFLVAGGLFLITRGIYGIALFIAIPIALGALAECYWRSSSSSGAAGIGAKALLLSNLAFFLLGIEGAICIAMSAPLTIPLGALGGYLAHVAMKSRSNSNRTAAMLLVLPLTGGSLGFDLTATPPTFAVTTSIEIAASPERIWKYIVSFPDLPAPEEWFFKAGVAYPMRVSIDGSGVGAVRYCEFSTGPFVEPIEIWDESRLLQFSVTQSPASMHEWSLWGKVNPKHLHGYLVSERGQFRLTPLPNGHTLLEGTSWYRHGLWPAQYWRFWSDAILHRIHLRVLTHIRDLAETDAP